MNFLIFAIFCSTAALAFAKDYGNTLNAGDQTDINTVIVNADRNFRQSFQSDGNLVVYRQSDGKHYWTSQTIGFGAVKAVMQRDGQFSMYKEDGTRVWSTNTYDAARNLKLEKNGNLIVYNALGKPVWTSFKNM
jgi:hypothetical protein